MIKIPETFRALLIEACVTSGMSMGVSYAIRKDTTEPAAVVGFNVTKLDRYIEMLEGLVNGEDLVRVQLLIAEKYRARSTQK